MTRTVQFPTALRSPHPRLVSVLVPLLVLGCSRTPVEPEPPPKPMNVDTRRAPAPSAAPAVTALEKEDLSPGAGPAAKTGDTVRVHYTGRLLDGTKFDSSLDRGEPFEFTLGRGMVIRGWDEGVPGMKKGGKRKLRIPSELAYGKTGSPPKIPPDAALEFEVELVEIVK